MTIQTQYKFNVGELRYVTDLMEVATKSAELKTSMTLRTTNLREAFRLMGEAAREQFVKDLTDARSDMTTVQCEQHSYVAWALTVTGADRLTLNEQVLLGRSMAELIPDQKSEVTALVRGFVAKKYLTTDDKSPASLLIAALAVMAGIKKNRPKPVVTAEVLAARSNKQLRESTGKPILDLSEFVKQRDELQELVNLMSARITAAVPSTPDTSLVSA